MTSPIEHETNGTEVAIVGMAGRFPGAEDIDALWRNIRDGVESVATFTDQALRQRGVSEAVLADAHYVKAGAVLEDMDRFDAGFFGYSPREAEQLDPQQRVFLETAWHALEHAGHAGERRDQLVGIYAGCGANVYLLRHLLSNVDWRSGDIASLLGLMNGNDKDSLATRVAYKLDLRGPAVTVQTACSTSLVAVHLACRSLLNQETDMALAGGVWLNLLQDGGYHHQPGAILSPDGHCRAFDARAAGTVIGSGAGIVVLRRLADALADGDTVHAVIKGSALNNDGAAKVGYTAPSVEGQAEVILAAQAMAEVSPDSIGYVEAHGTGTTLGDPIEVAALTQAFRTGTRRAGYCALGSVKTNIGHLDAAAGVAGLIKTALALKHKTLPPSLNFEQPNPKIAFADSPFFVNTEARPWPAGETPRRAGVSSFGMGGTNVHVVLEEAPPLPQCEDLQAESPALLVLSARSEAALETSIDALARHLAEHPEQRLGDVAHTLRTGRKCFEHRAALPASGGTAWVRGRALSQQPTVAFLFPGQGAQPPAMGRALYETEPVFRAAVDRCSVFLHDMLGLDLRALIYPSTSEEADTSAERLAQTAMTQPALFVVEYALAQWWMHQGIRPDAMLGHSIGEYVAACLAGVFTLEDALRIVAERGRLLQAMAPGAMLAVSVPEAQLQADGLDGCDLAAVNAADLCVLSGPVEAIDRAERNLLQRGAAARRLHVTRAFHSAMVEPMLASFEALLRGVSLRAPQIPFVSNLTGRWITSEEAADPVYWVRHVRATVRFAEGLDALLAKPDRLLLEVGPGETLTALARRHALAGTRPVLASQAHPQRAAHNAGQPMRCLAAMWVAGVEAAAIGGSDARRVPLPGYPFERRSYWIAPSIAQAGKTPDPSHPDVSGTAGWLYEPVWRRAPLPPHTGDTRSVPHGCTLLLGDRGGLVEPLDRALQAAGRPVVRVCRGKAFARTADRSYAVRPGVRDDFEQVLLRVEAEFGPVSDVCDTWSVDPGDPLSPADALPSGYDCLIALAQALGGMDAHKVSLTVVTSGLEDLTGAETLRLEKALLHGPCKVIPQEHPHMACRMVDVVPSSLVAMEDIARQVAAEIEAAQSEPVVAYRGPHRWIQRYEPLRNDAPPVERLRHNGVYLITGGLGGIGLVLARHLATRWQARLALLGRNMSPSRREAVAELEALGAEVLVIQADVSDAAQMRASVEDTRRRFGGLNGIVHAAGFSASHMIGQWDRAAALEVLAPKVGGTRALMSATADEVLDFVVFFSSLASVAGGLGKADYAAANAYLDAMAADAMRRSARMTVSINWDGWRDVGMAAGMQWPGQFGIAPEQGVEVFERIVNGPLQPRTIVSTTEPGTRLGAALNDVLAMAAPGSAKEASTQSHPRPALSTDYVAPNGDLECGLARFWRELIGISQVGVNDNLFELGGDSLLAVQLLAKVRAAYGVEVHPAAFFREPTIAGLGVLVETKLIEDIERGESPARPFSEPA